MRRPPPPNNAGARGLVPPPVPPPPPRALTAALLNFVRDEVRPRTEAICLAGLVDDDLDALCLEMANAFAKPHAGAGGLPLFMPLCADVCYHSCAGASRTDTDGFETCRGPECADSPCEDFLRRSCRADAHTQATIARLRAAACTYVHPSPPTPPTPPPWPMPPLGASEPPSPPPPPTAEAGTLRLAADERPETPDCAPVSYSACRRAAEQLAAASATDPDVVVSGHVELSQATCEGIAPETSSCFLGCALGNELGLPALFTFLRPSVAAGIERGVQPSQFMSHRCKDNLEHPYCLCGTPPPPPPPPNDVETLLRGGELFTFAGSAPPRHAADHVADGGSADDALLARPTGYYKAVAVDGVIPTEFASNLHAPYDYECPGADDGAPECTRRCASDLLGGLRAFHVVATAAPPTPPPPSPPPFPPAPPPSPTPPLSEYRFNGATDACQKQKIYIGSECRDGGPVRPIHRHSRDIDTHTAPLCTGICVAAPLRLRRTGKSSRTYHTRILAAPCPLISMHNLPCLAFNVLLVGAFALSKFVPNAARSWSRLQSMVWASATRNVASLCASLLTSVVCGSSELPIAVSYSPVLPGVGHPF